MVGNIIMEPWRNSGILVVIGSCQKGRFILIEPAVPANMAEERAFFYGLLSLVCILSCPSLLLIARLTQIDRCHRALVCVS